MAKTYGYNNFNYIAGKSIVFDSFGDYFHEVLEFNTATNLNTQLLIRRVQIYKLSQAWTMTFGSSNGNLAVPRGTRMSTDDSYLLIPFNPTGNPDYMPPSPANTNYVGLMSVQTSVGSVYWCNVYTPTTTFAVQASEGAVSPDNIRYYYLLKEATVTKYMGILTVRIADGSVVKFVRIGDRDVTPLGIAVSWLDRLAFNMVVNPAVSVLFFDNTQTSDNLVVAQWDSYLGETMCASYTFNTPAANTFTAISLATVNAGNVNNYKTRTSVTLNPYSVYSVNCPAQDTTSSNALVAMIGMQYQDLGATCTTNGYRIYVSL